MGIPLDEVIYVEGIASSATGAAVDADSTPTFVVLEEATDTDIGVGGNMTKRTSLTGDYRASFTASAANGFEVGKWYAVIGSATIGGIACKGVLKHFRIVAAEAVAGKPKVDVDAVAGTAQTAGDLMATLTTIAAYIDTEVAAIKSKTDNLPSDPADQSAVEAAITAATSALATATKLRKYIQLLARKDAAIATDNATELTEINANGGSGVGAFANTTDALEALRDRGDAAWVTGSSSLSGPYTRTITIEDAADDSPIENATVRLYRTGESETQLSDASGKALFTTEAATWTYSVTANGYAGAAGTIVITDDGETTVQLTATAIAPPTNPSLSAIEVLCLDSAGQPESGVDVDIRIVEIPSGSQNIAFKGAKQAATSGGDGIARFEVVQGSTCEWKRGLAEVWERVSIDVDGVTSVTSVIGSP